MINVCNVSKKILNEKTIYFLFLNSDIVDEPGETSLEIEPLNDEFNVQPNNLPGNNKPEGNDFDDGNSELMTENLMIDKRM